jgi:signal peptidase I
MKGWMRALLWTVLVVGVVFGILRYWFIDFYRIPDDPNDVRSWANAPNLEPGDLVLVWRAGTPHIGDLVRCPDPADSSRWMIARVIGVPGDKISWGDQGLRINNFRVRTLACDHPARKVFDPAAGVDVDMPCQGEEIAGSHHDLDNAPTVMPMLEVTVEEGKYFVLSDNRFAPWSYDSRNYEVGQVPMEGCKQRMLLRLFSHKGWSDSERRFSFLF